MPTDSTVAPESTTGRLEAFSDGVIAIAITLLVLEISIPSGPGSLLDRLGSQWIVYAAYLVSFVIVAAAWLSHHALIRDLRRTDHPLLVLNLALLLVVSFIPFPTKVVGEELFAAEFEDQRTAAVLYGATLIALAVAFNALWWWARRRGLLHPQLPEAAITARTRQYLIGPVAYAVTTALAFLHPLASIIATGLVALTFLLPAHLLKESA